MTNRVCAGLCRLLVSREKSHAEQRLEGELNALRRVLRDREAEIADLKQLAIPVLERKLEVQERSNDCLATEMARVKKEIEAKQSDHSARIADNLTGVSK
jgi:hypothetical protein